MILIMKNFPSRGKTSEDDIDIDIKYFGFCHTDANLVLNHEGISNYPIVPGHKIADVVTKASRKIFVQTLPHTVRA